MAGFSDRFIDEVRAANKASDVVQSLGLKIRRAGAGGEWCLADDKSFTISDKKGLIHDHGRTGFSGDVFTFYMDQRGCTFPEAIEALARRAGISLPKTNGNGHHRNGNGNGHGTAFQAPEPPPLEEDPYGGMQQGEDGSYRQPARQTLTKVYPYTDPDGAVIYEVCRFEWEDDGKKRKRFSQRRPHPTRSGHHLYGLGAGEYLRPQWTMDSWYQATEEKLKNWKGKIAERVQIDDDVAHGLYNFADIVDEQNALNTEGECRAVWWPEGEKDADTLTAWDILATTVSGGANNVRDYHAQHFRGMDVIIPVDSDKAGRECGRKKAMLLRGVAKRIRILDFRDHTPGFRDKGDVTDWRNYHGGNRAKLMQIVDRLPDWTPTPPESTFGAVRFADLDLPAKELEWLIKGIITRGEVSIWWGQPGCGKSFILTDAALGIARGGIVDGRWFGQRVKQGLVIYQAGEGGLGLKRRLRAYRQFHNIPPGADLPFILLPSRINLWEADTDTDRFIEEIKAWKQFYDAPLELVVIDTMAAASTGANENASEDVGRVLQRCHRIAEQTGAHVALVHHTPKGGGSERGWSGIRGNVESSIEIIRTNDKIEEEYPNGGRKVRDRREMWIRKQKDGEDGACWSFFLKPVELGKDQHGDAITSCVVGRKDTDTAVSRDTAVIPPGYMRSKNPNTVPLLNALADALATAGRAPDDDAAKSAPMGTRAVTIAEWRAAYRRKLDAGEEAGSKEADKLDDRVKKAIERTYGQQGWADRDGLNVIVKVDKWVWRTTKKVWGVDPPPSPPPNRPAGEQNVNQEAMDQMSGFSYPDRD